jgi:prolyl oligopeptidase
MLKNLTQVYNYEKVGTPFKVGNNKYYFYKNDGLQNQYVLYERDTLSSDPKILIDPNTLSKDGTISLGSISFSRFELIY